MKEKVTEIVAKIAQPLAEELGLYVEEVEYVKLNTGMTLTVFISKPNGVVSITDCEALAHSMDAPLDEADPTNNQSYTFNVSSLGLDRPLKTTRDFERNLGQIIEVKLFAPLNSCKNFVGELISFSENEITLKQEKTNKVLTIDRKLVASCKPQITF